jgi:RNA polymerase sigma factor (sigma-70 family)
MAVKKYTLGQIIEGIQKRDNNVLTFVYKDLFPKVRFYVTRHGGSKDDAKDVFQESIIIIFKQIENNSLVIKGDFEAYLYGIARLVWLKVLRNKEIHNRNITQLEEPENNSYNADQMIEEELELKLLRKHFMSLGEECQKVMQMVTEGIPYEKIAEIMGYKSEKIVRNQKYKCKETLIQLIKSDPEYIRFMREKNS